MLTLTPPNQGLLRVLTTLTMGNAELGGLAPRLPRGLAPPPGLPLKVAVASGKGRLAFSSRDPLLPANMAGSS